MSDLKLKPCPMCGCRAEFDYGAPMNSGKRIVKVKCAIGCVEQNIFRCEEQDAAAAWNSRTQPEATAPAQDLSAAIPDGWQLVPVEPTDEMIEELRINIDFSYEEGLEISTGKYHPCALIKDGSIGEAYSAMLAAAPLASANALSAGDRVDWREVLADACIECEIPDSKYESLCIAINAAIQAQKDGHGHD